MKNIILLVALCLISSTSWAWDIRSAVDAQWKFNENEASSTVADYASTNTGTMTDSVGAINTSTVATAGKINGAFSFNGSTNSRYVDAGNIFRKTRGSTFSISAWIKTSSASNQVIAGVMNWGDDYQGYIFFVSSTGEIKFDFNTTGTTNELTVQTTENTFADGNWHHVVLTYSGTSTASGVKIYVDGVNKALTTLFNTLTVEPTYSSSFKIGLTKSTTTSRQFNGLIDNVIMCNRVLTQAEVTGLYNSGQGTEILFSHTNIINNSTVNNATIN